MMGSISNRIGDIFAIGMELMALGMCAYAATVRWSDRVGSTNHVWPALQIGGLIFLLVGLGTSIGLVAGSLVLAGCLPAYWRQLRSGRSCACYGDDDRFVMRSWPIAGAMWISALITMVMGGGAYLVFPSTSAALERLAIGFSMLGVAILSRRRRGKGRTLALGESRTIHPPIEKPWFGRNDGRPVVGYFGEMGCLACASASRDFIDFSKAFGGDFTALLAVKGYPVDAPRHFEGASVIEWHDIPVEWNLSVAPSLFVVRKDGMATVFEGLSNFRLGLGHALMERS